MNLISLKIPIYEIKNNDVKGVWQYLNYTICLNELRIDDFNHSILIPANTIILSPASELLRLTSDSKKANILFNDKKLMQTYNEFKFNGKKVSTGLIEKHELIDEVLDKTPVFIERDSIKDSTWLIELSKVVSAYESILPQKMAPRYLKLKKSLERIQPISTQSNIARIKKGLAFTGPQARIAREGFRIKSFPEKGHYYFTSNGEPFYTLGNLARLCIEVKQAWYR